MLKVIMPLSSPSEYGFTVTSIKIVLKIIYCSTPGSIMSVVVEAAVTPFLFFLFFFFFLHANSLVEAAETDAL